jgi:hypothetical protein
MAARTPKIVSAVAVVRLAWTTIRVIEQLQVRLLEVQVRARPRRVCRVWSWSFLTIRRSCSPWPGPVWAGATRSCSS